MYKHLVICIASFAISKSIAAQLPSAATSDYCKLKCEDLQHTMCLYTNPSPAENCNKVIREGLSEKEKRIVLDKHNELRRKVASGKETRGAPGPQPAAKNIPDLEWDDELALLAQRWANQCEYDHDCSDVARFPTGQNIAEASGGAVKIESLVQDWYDEVQDFNGKEVSSYNPPDDPEDDKVSHYTQLIWAKTTKLGCGSIVYDHEEQGVTTSLVCNYGPSGNVEGEPVYQKK